MSDLPQFLSQLWDVAPRITARLERTTRALFGKQRFMENLTVRRSFELATQRAAKLGITIDRAEASTSGMAGLAAWNRPTSADQDAPGAVAAPFGAAAQVATGEAAGLWDDVAVRTRRFADTGPLVLVAPAVTAQPEAFVADSASHGDAPAVIPTAEATLDTVRVGVLLRALAAAQRVAVPMPRAVTESLVEQVVQRHREPLSINRDGQRASAGETESNLVPSTRQNAPAAFSYLVPEDRARITFAAEDAPAYGRSIEAASPPSAAALSMTDMLANTARIERLSARLSGLSVGLFAADAEDFSSLTGLARFGTMRDVAPRIARFIESLRGVHAMNDASVRPMSASNAWASRTFVDVGERAVDANSLQAREVADMSAAATPTALPREISAAKADSVIGESVRRSDASRAIDPAPRQLSRPTTDAFIARSLMPAAAQSMGWSPTRIGLRPGSVGAQAERWATGVEASAQASAGDSGLVALAPARQFLQTPIVRPALDAQDRVLTRVQASSPSVRVATSADAVVATDVIAPQVASAPRVSRPFGAAARAAFAAERIGPRLIATFAKRRAMAMAAPAFTHVINDAFAQAVPRAAVAGGEAPARAMAPEMSPRQRAREAVVRPPVSSSALGSSFSPTYLAAGPRADERASASGTFAAPAVDRRGGPGELGVVAEAVASRVGLRAAALMTALVDPVADLANADEAASPAMNQRRARTAPQPTFSSQELALLTIFPQLADTLQRETQQGLNVSPAIPSLARVGAVNVAQPISQAFPAAPQRARRAASLWPKVTGAPSRLQGQMREFVRTRRQPAGASEGNVSAEPLWQKLPPTTVVGATFHDADPDEMFEESAAKESPAARPQSRRRRRKGAMNMPSVRPERFDPANEPRDAAPFSGARALARSIQPQPVIAAQASGDSAASMMRAVRQGTPGHSRPSDDRITLGDLTLISFASSTKQIAASPEGGGAPPKAAPTGPDAGGATPNQQTDPGGSSPGNDIEMLAQYVYDEFKRLTQIARDRNGDPWES